MSPDWISISVKKNNNPGHIEKRGKKTIGEEKLKEEILTRLLSRFSGTGKGGWKAVSDPASAFFWLEEPSGFPYEKATV